MRRYLLMFAFGLLATCGCSEAVRRDEPLKISDVPKEILKVAQERLPNIKFDQAWKTKFKGQDAYELRGKNDRGKVREVEVSLSGEVLEVE
ncbi:MAG TPA: hypothetical protein VHC19_17030 [Pirellulales bacterium]|nr:hypothetical protein [Pirellulales bacterium]